MCGLTEHWHTEEHKQSPVNMIAHNGWSVWRKILNSGAREDKWMCIYVCVLRPVQHMKRGKCNALNFKKTSTRSHYNRPF